MLKYSTYRSIYDETREVQSAGDDSVLEYVIRMKKSAATLFGTLMSLFRRGQLVKLAMILMLAVSGFTVVGNVFAGSVSSVMPAERVVVERGDSLWSIALAHKPSDMRTVVYIEGIKKASGLKGSDIQAGDVLTLPAY
ncbi:LysM peptidoglycan-binding domain-containing protein [Paenibacillus typhae]|uniref:LysM domain-containing protein n=1 Tax=Paenibacillus typhae TaxID=1174501 RepID=A0A1G8H7F6_9BACL|nr:LysM peptidoglycan-binding domain-containing protein [Paenibacillus typhae]MBY0009849.1 LysM peptidoglycan-binding domain-containing protein [Paenibacillus typhae]SDI02461.1 LysM domain-containing protein [Paenibacillus typhae]